MRNHFHLAIELTEANLSDGMQWLQGTWVRRYNLIRKITGRPFQDRFKALVVEPGAAFSGVCDYIHLNPVRAGAVSADKLLDYPWSSLPKWESPLRPKWMDSSTVLGEYGGLADKPPGWRRYRQALAGMSENHSQAKQKRGKSLSRGWCLGSAEFRLRMKTKMTEREMDLEAEHLLGLESEEIRSERAQAWEARLQTLARIAKIRLDRLSDRKSDPAKTLLAAAMKQVSSVSNAWLAQKLAMGMPASASQFVRRRLLTQSGRAEVNMLLSKVKP